MVVRGKLMLALNAHSFFMQRVHVDRLA